MNPGPSGDVSRNPLFPYSKDDAFLRVAKFPTATYVEFLFGRVRV